MKPENQNIKPLKKYWVCVDKANNPDECTISSTKYKTLKLWEQQNSETWQWYEERGFKCIQVDISFNPAKK